jgi:predicted nucleic acid-binding protein
LDSDAVTNSTCLIGLERIERLDILPQVFSTITIPTAVAAEVGIEADWLIVRTVQNLAVVTTLKTQVDSGEAEAIALEPVSKELLSSNFVACQSSKH